MSAKNLDKKGRWRNKTVAFRVSSEEWDLINRYVALSGLQKQDYILKRLTEKEIIVRGNPKVYKALKNELQKVYLELKRIETKEELPDEMMDVIKMIAVIMDGMNAT